MTQDNACPAVPGIEAIFLDVGNTLRIVLDDPPFRVQAKADLMTLVDAQEPEEAFFERLEARWNAYRKASKKSLIEASERELWTVHLLPDYPPERIGPLAGKLTRLWRDHDGRRVPRPDVKETVIELDRRGYRLGIIANTITETEIPDWMAVRWPDRLLQGGRPFLEGRLPQAQSRDLLGGGAADRGRAGEVRLCRRQPCA